MHPDLGERRKLWEVAGLCKSPTSLSTGPLSAAPIVLYQKRDYRGSQPGSWEWVSMRLGTGTGGCGCGGNNVPHHPPDFLDPGCHPHIRQACWAGGEVSSPDLLPQTLIWPNPLPLPMSQLRIREARPHRPEHRPLPAPLGPPHTLHCPSPLCVCEAVQTQGRMQPHASRWPSQERTPFCTCSPPPESESRTWGPTPS